MDKTFAGLLGAVGAVMAGTVGHAAPVDPVLHASSYAELLRPVPNAVATLKALDEREAVAAKEAELVQYYYAPRPPPRYYDRHHHHHNRYRRPRYHHHHHNDYDRR